MPVVLVRVEGMNFPQVTAKLLAEWPEYEEWIFSPGNDAAYGQAIREAWNGESDLLLNEHDVLAPTGALRALWDCPQGWCSCPVWLGNHYSSRTLGLVKFSDRLQRHSPLLADRALGGPGTGQPAKPWWSVDAALLTELDLTGIPLHVHAPVTRHFHYDSEPGR